MSYTQDIDIMIGGGRRLAALLAHTSVGWEMLTLKVEDGRVWPIGPSEAICSDDLFRDAMQLAINWSNEVQQPITGVIYSGNMAIIPQERIQELVSEFGFGDEVKVRGRKKFPMAV